MKTFNANALGTATSRRVGQKKGTRWLQRIKWISIYQMHTDWSWFESFCDMFILWCFNYILFATPRFFLLSMISHRPLLLRLFTWFMHDLMNLLIQVLSPPHQRIRPSLPQAGQVVVLVTIKTLLQLGASADATHRDRRDGFTDDW